jgi:uncharacterized protein (TIGR02444 family)
VSGLESRFWSFSLAVHSGPGVQAECLALQDRYGIDVNLLLFCAYIGAVHGAVLPDAELREARDLVGAWHHDIVRKLRDARRALKPFAAPATPSGASAAAQELRSTVKAAELESERIEQTMLEQWSAGRLEAWPGTEPERAVAVNIQNLLRLDAEIAQPPEMPAHLVAAALSAARSRRR